MTWQPVASWPVLGLLVALALTGTAMLRPGSAEDTSRIRRTPRVVVVVVPGLSWEVALDLIARGKLPALAGIIEGDRAIGDVVTSSKAGDAETLASIVTGRFGFKHRVHQVSDFALLDARPGSMQTPVWESLRGCGRQAAALGFPFGEASPFDAERLLRAAPEQHFFIRLAPMPGLVAPSVTTPAVVERRYVQLDDTLAGLIAAAGKRNTTWMLVSGKAAPDAAGIGRGRLRIFERRREAGFFLAWGHGIKRTWVAQTIDPVDLTPTALYLAGCPIPNDMDGIVLFEMLDDGYFFEQRLAFSR